MKYPLLIGVAFASLAGYALAGHGPRADSPREEMRADKDGDGRVSRGEADAAAAQRTSEWFTRLDLDKDGFVTQDETRQARDTRRGEMQERFDEHFKTADANSDGSLSLDEVQANMPRMAGRFDSLDKDKNGLLSREELKRKGHHRPEPKT